MSESNVLWPEGRSLDQGFSVPPDPGDLRSGAKQQTRLSVMQSTANAEHNTFKQLIFRCCVAQVPTTEKVRTSVVHASYQGRKNYTTVETLLLSGPGKKTTNKKTHRQIFPRDYPGTIPGLSRPFPAISWEFCLCVSLFPQEKGKHINKLTPTHFRDNPAKLFMFTIQIFGLQLNSWKIFLCNLCNALHAHYIFLFPEDFLM